MTFWPTTTRRSLLCLPFVGAAFALCGLFYFPARVWANQVSVGLTGGFFQCDRTRRLSSAFWVAAMSRWPPYQLKFPSGIKCGGYTVAFAAVTLHAEIDEKAAMGCRFECDASFTDASVAAQT